MAIKRIIDVNFWNDDKVMDLFSVEEKLFMLYLLTNPHTTQLGIYSINKKHIAFETGIAIEKVNVLLEKFEKKYNIIKYSNETKEIAIRNYLKYSIFTGGKPMEDLLLKEIKQVKDKNLLEYVFLNLQDYEELNTTVKKIMDDIINQNQKQNQKQKQKQKSYPKSYNDSCDESYNESCRNVISHLNQLAGTNFEVSSKTNQKLIKALLEDYSFDDIILVIDKMCYLWNREPKKGEKDMRLYLRPSTLFRRSNFENYLGMNVPQKKITTTDLAKTLDFSEFR